MTLIEAFEELGLNYYSDRYLEIKEIEKIYKKLARQYHPDMNINMPDYVKKLAEEKFKKINEAISIIRENHEVQSQDRQRRWEEEKRQEEQRKYEETKRQEEQRNQEEQRKYEEEERKKEEEEARREEEEREKREEIKEFIHLVECLRFLQKINSNGLTISKLKRIFYNLKTNVLFEWQLQGKIFNILKNNPNISIELEETEIYKAYFYLYNDKIKKELEAILNRYSKKKIDFDKYLKENIFNFIEVLDLPKELKQDFPILKYIIKYLKDDKIIKQFDCWIFSLANYIEFLELEDKSLEKYIINKINNKQLNDLLSKIKEAKVKSIYKEYRSSKNYFEQLCIILNKKECSKLKIKLEIKKGEMNIPSIKYLWEEAWRKGYVTRKDCIPVLLLEYIKNNKLFLLFVFVFISLVLGLSYLLYLHNMGY